VIDPQDAPQLVGADLVDGAEERVGRIGHVFLDERTGAPEWVTVRTGFFDSRESFVPLHGADRTAFGVRVPYTRNQIKGAPTVETAGDRLDESEEAQLYRYYGLEAARIGNGGSQEPAHWVRTTPPAGLTVLPGGRLQGGDVGVAEPRQPRHAGEAGADVDVAPFVLGDDDRR
jgi:hypothetical protein